MTNCVRVNKSVIVTASAIYAGEIMADLSSDNIIVLSVYDGDEDRSVEIDREVFKEFVKTIEEV